MKLSSSVIAVALVACAMPAFAQRRDKAEAEAKVSGSYAGSFEVVANNCDATGMSLERETIVVSQDDRAIAIAIDGVPEMKGRLGRRGKVRADAPRTRARAGAEASYGISGRIESGRLHMVFIAEYHRGDKPLCTQSWSVTGRRK